MIDCRDLDEAIDWAAKIAERRERRLIEIRPVMDYEARGRGGPAAPGGGLVDGRRAAVVDRLFRQESGRAVATLIRVLGDFDLAEEAVQEAFVIALERWPRDGVPRQPRRLDRRAPRATARSTGCAASAATRTSCASWSCSGARTARRPGRGLSAIPDDRLRLFFTCCHPALAPEARVALTLRTLGGLSTPEVARAFLTARRAMQQRLVRAKRKIRDGGHPLRGAAGPRAARPAALACSPSLYLIFNEGYLATSGDALVRRELCDEAIRLGRLLAELMPDEPEVARPAGADAAAPLAPRRARRRRPASWCCSRTRTARAGTRDEIEEGARRWRRAARRDGPSRSRPRSPPSTRARPRRDRLGAHRARSTRGSRRSSRSPVVELNRAVAVAMADGPGRRARARSTSSEARRARRLPPAPRRRERTCCAGSAASEEAARAYGRALELTTNPVERALPRAAPGELSA